MKNHFLNVSVPGIVLAFLLLATSALAGPVSHFGALQACGNNICGAKTGTSTAIFFKGPSLYWSDGTGAPFYNIETVDWFVDNMQIGIIRAAMAIRYYKECPQSNCTGNDGPVDRPGGVPGYYFNKPLQKNYIKKVIDAAIENDIYVIVDWHSHDAHRETTDARNFFVEIANEYKNVPNIIWEVYNEPVSASNQNVTDHANTIVTALRQAGNNNLVLIGSPNYSQQPKAQGDNWGSSKDKNVAFTFHFYAGTHGEDGGIKSSAQGARTAGYAVFGTEWGAVNADGNGNVSTANSNSWTTWMDGAKISNCMWNASSLNEGSSMFTSGTGSSSLSTTKLTSSGQYFQTYMNSNKWTAQIPSNHPKGNDMVGSVADGNSITFNATQLGLVGAITGADDPDFGEVIISSDGKSITYKTSESGSPSDKIRFMYKITQGSVTVQSKIVISITNRRPILLAKDPIAVSRKAKTYLGMQKDLSASDPNGLILEITNVSISPSSAGAVAISEKYKDTIIFTPATSQYNVELSEATLSYTIKNSNGQSSSASVVLKLQNFAPTITPITNTTCCSMTNVPNTEPKVGLGMAQFNGKDKDGDSIWFETLYLDPKYPGRVEQVKPDSFVYYPDPGKTGKVVFLAIITDGVASSPTGRANLTLTGSGSPIGDLPAPTEIPGVTPIIYQSNNAGNVGLASLGLGKIELYFSQSGYAKLDVYSLSGKNMGSLLNGWQNAGSSAVSLKNLNLQKGVYILRLKQGSQIKILRVVN